MPRSENATYMILYMSESNAAENPSKLHVPSPLSSLEEELKTFNPDRCCTFHSLFHFSSSRITLKRFIACSTSPRLESRSKAVTCRACHLAAQKLSETTRVLAACVIPVRCNIAPVLVLHLTSCTSVALTLEQA